MLQIVIAEDQSVAIHRGRKGQTEVFHSGEAERVNALDVTELAAVVNAVRICPFPLYSDVAERVYRDVLGSLIGSAGDKIRRLDLGQCRLAVLRRASEGNQTPHQHYLRVAYQIKTGAPVKL